MNRKMSLSASWAVIVHSKSRLVKVVRTSSLLTTNRSWLEGVSQEGWLILHLAPSYPGAAKFSEDIQVTMAEPSASVLRNEERVLAELEHGPMALARIREFLKIDWCQLRKVVERLEKQGRVLLHTELLTRGGRPRLVATRVEPGL